jgi:hypothetical protein
MQTFSQIIEEGRVYDDKTHFLFNLVSGGESRKNVFLSRPRRFGKSLLVSTLKSLFQGRQDLFEGLFINSTDYDFEPFPVVHLDMSCLARDALEQSLLYLMEDLEIMLDLPCSNVTEPVAKLRRIITTLNKKYGKKVVLLIDEYDTPILSCLEQPQEAKATRDSLKKVYSLIKQYDEYIRFAFVTGVSKFSRAALFSGMNSMMDISLDDSYANICGFAVDRLTTLFREHLEELVTDFPGIETTEQLLAKICKYYDGYSWNGKDRLINPFSLLNFFACRRFDRFWYNSGTPTFLLDILRVNGHSGMLDISHEIMPESEFSGIDVTSMPWRALMLQTGYYTIEKIEEGEGERELHLQVPNYEVAEALRVDFARRARGVREDEAPYGDISAKNIIVHMSDVGLPLVEISKLTGLPTDALTEIMENSNQGR